MISGKGSELAPVRFFETSGCGMAFLGMASRLLEGRKENMPGEVSLELNMAFITSPNMRSVGPALQKQTLSNLFTKNKVDMRQTTTVGRSSRQPSA